MDSLFTENRSSIADTAWALTVYSMVPYLGILFVPLGLAFGVYGWFNSSNRTLAIYSICFDLFILAVQIFLWWLLYYIPTISGGI